MTRTDEVHLRGDNPVTSSVISGPSIWWDWGDKSGLSERLRGETKVRRGAGREINATEGASGAIPRQLRHCEKLQPKVERAGQQLQQKVLPGYRGAREPECHVVRFSN